MKFVHMADMHFDSPFVNLANRDNLAKKRRLEQRKAMKEIVEYIKENNILYFFIAGDLYEQEYIKTSTIEYINNLFKEIPNTKIYITPGNHDPYITNSFYKQFNWNNNVHIFNEKLQIIENDEVDIYGYGFNDFYMKNKYKNIEIKNKNKINILIMHASLNGNAEENRDYNSVTTVEMKKYDFDYIALGHIHKKYYNDYENQKIVYPGSTVSLGFDEQGPRGVIVGEISEKNNKIKLDFLPIKSKEFSEKNIDISNMYSEEELIEFLNQDNYDENKFYKINLTGKRKFEIDIYELMKLITKENIIKLKNNTILNYNIEDISKETTLKGLFAKKILEKIEQNDITEKEKEKLENAFEIGMNVLNK